MLLFTLDSCFYPINHIIIICSIYSHKDEAIPEGDTQPGDQDVTEAFEQFSFLKTQVITMVRLSVSVFCLQDKHEVKQVDAIVYRC